MHRVDTSNPVFTNSSSFFVGSNTTVQVSVPLYDRVKSVDSIVVLDEAGSTVSTQPLHNVGGRRGKSLYKTHIIVPSSVSIVSVNKYRNPVPDDKILALSKFNPLPHNSDFNPLPDDKF